MISSMVKFTSSSSKNVRLFPLEKYLFLSRQVQTRITNLEPSLTPCHKNRRIWRVASYSCVVQNEKRKWSEGHKQWLVTALLLYILNSLNCIWTRGETSAYTGFKQVLDCSIPCTQDGFCLIEKLFLKNGILLAKFSLNGLVFCRYWYADRMGVAANS